MLHQRSDFFFLRNDAEISPDTAINWAATKEDQS
jgi:hypothetical protein